MTTYTNKQFKGTTGVEGKFGSNTVDNLAQNQRKRDIDSKIYLLDPNSAPFTLLMSKLTDQKATDPKFSWFEDEYLQEWDEVQNAAGTGTTFTVENVESFEVGDVCILPSTASREVVLVTAVPAGTGSGDITVQRGIGGTPDSIGAATPIYIIGDAHEEFSDIPTAKGTIKEEIENYAQIFKTVVPGISGTLKATDLITGDEARYQKMKFGVEHAKKIEKSAIFGKKYQDLTGTKPKRYTGGLLSFISSNVTGSVGTLTEDVWDAWTRDLFEYGSNKKVVFVSSLIASKIDGFAKGKLQMYPKDTTYGIKVLRYINSEGEVPIIVHKRLLKGSIFGGYAIGVDMENAIKKTLRPTQLKVVDNDNLDGDSWYYMTETGFKWPHEETHALMTGVTG